MLKPTSPKWEIQAMQQLQQEQTLYVLGPHTDHDDDNRPTDHSCSNEQQTDVTQSTSSKHQRHNSHVCAKRSTAGVDAAAAIQCAAPPLGQHRHDAEKSKETGLVRGLHMTARSASGI